MDRERDRSGFPSCREAEWQHPSASIQTPVDRHRCSVPRWRFHLLSVALAFLTASPIPLSARRVLDPDHEPSSASEHVPSGTQQTQRESPTSQPTSSAGFAAFGTAADTTAGDSIVYSAQEIEYDMDSKVILMLGNASVRYGGMVLTAYRIRFITEHDLVIAEGHAEGDSIVGRPRFSSAAESFTGIRMVYNIRTQRGLVEGGRSAAPEGIYEGRVIKRTGQEQVDVYRGVYTTCDHNPPHYVFEGTEMRVLVGDKVIARPVVMKVAGVPVAWLPFGVFFINKDRRSGFLSPRMGERQRDGRFMYGLGYYVALNDYFGTLARLDINERIGFGCRSTSEYAWRYRLSGRLETTYSRDWSTATSAGARVWTVTAGHQHEIAPRARMTANVSYRSQKTPGLGTYQTLATVLDQSYTSTLDYTQSWESGYSVRAGLAHSENLQTHTLNQTVPSISLSSGRRFFFPEAKPRGRRDGKLAGEAPWYRRLGYSWSWNGANTRSRGAAKKTFYDTWEFKDVRSDSTIIYRLYLYPESGISPYTGRFRVIIRDGFGDIATGLIRDAGGDTLTLYTSMGTDVGTAVMLTQNALQVRLPGYDDTNDWQRIRIDDLYAQTTGQSFSLSLPLPTPRWLNLTPSFGWGASWMSRPDSAAPHTVHTFTGGVSSGATFYGLFPINVGPLVALRHVFTPSAGFNYVVRRDMRDGTYIFGGGQIGGDTSRVLDLNLRNVVQMKTRWRGKERKFDQLVALSTGIRYNRDALGRRWSNPSTSVQFLPSKFFDVRVGMVHTLYKTVLDTTGNRGYQLDWQHPRLTSLSINSSLRFAGGGARPSELGEEGYASQEREIVSGGLQQQPLGSVVQRSRTPSAFSGWNVNLQHTYGWRRREPGTTFIPTPTNELDLNLSFSPWRDWWVEFSTHYDVRENRRDSDRIVITRRLHCWEARLRWVPRGYDKGYYFIINIIDLPDIKVESASENQSPFRG